MTVEPGSANGIKPTALVTDDGRVGAAEEKLARELAERARAEAEPDRAGRAAGTAGQSGAGKRHGGEMDAHLGYAKHDRAGDGSGNSRNGHRGKTVSPM